MGVQKTKPRFNTRLPFFKTAQEIIRIIISRLSIHRVQIKTQKYYFAILYWLSIQF